MCMKNKVSRRSIWTVIIVVLMLALTACSTGKTEPAGSRMITTPDKASAPPVRTPSAVPTFDNEPSDSFQEGVFVGLTYQRPDGNRVVPGKGGFPDSDVVDISLEGVPRWLTAVPYQEGTLWVAVLEGGEVQGFALRDQSVREVDLEPGHLPPGSPPLIAVRGREISLVRAPTQEASELTHPVLLNPERGRMVFVARDGDLVLWEEGRERDRLSLNALPDGRILKDERGRLLVLSDPTRRYGHGVLGDDVEASSLTLVRTRSEFALVRKIEIPSPAVIEGTMPLWVDLDGDGIREILVTVSDSAQGARLVLYGETGDILAVGPEIGQGFRWRHQIAAAPLGPEGEMEVVDVLTPHLGGIVEFFTWSGERLIKEAATPEYSSHSIGSRNLDMGLVGNFDGGGHSEVLVPDRSQESLAAVRHTGEGAKEVWSLNVGGTLTTNITGVSLPGGRIAVGVGHDQDGLRIWLP